MVIGVIVVHVRAVSTPVPRKITTFLARAPAFVISIYTRLSIKIVNATAATVAAVVAAVAATVAAVAATVFPATGVGSDCMSKHCSQDAQGHSQFQGVFFSKFPFFAVQKSFDIFFD